MPIMYVNPARRRRRKKRVVKKRRNTRRKKTSASRKNTTQKRTIMAKTKRRRAKRRRPAARRAVKRRNPRKRKSTKRKSAKRVSAGKKAARTRKRNLRKRRSPKRRANPRRRKAARRRVSAKRRNPRRRVKRRVRRRAASSRRSPIRRRKRRRNSTYTRGPIRVYRNARRRRRGGRRNPGVKDIMKLMMKKVVPIVGALYVARLASSKLTDKIPGIKGLDIKIRAPVMAAGMMLLGHFATAKIKPLKEYREEIMIGLGINLVDKLLTAFAPKSVKDAVGLSDYVTVDDYIQIGNGVPPIQDNITLSDYVMIGDDEGLEEDLGMGELYQDLGVLEQDLGVEMDLGGFANRHLGGVSRQSMEAPLQHKRYLAPVPARSFTKPVPDFTDKFDAQNRVYTGIFSGGFGC